MAETVAHHVVNGTQSVGEPSPIDAPEETQTSNRSGGGVGEETAQKHTSTNTPFQDTEFDSISVQQSSTSENADQSVQLEDPNALLQDTQDASSFVGSREPASEGPNGIQSRAAFADPSPISADTELEWRRAASDTQPPMNRGERSNSIKKPTAFKSVSVTKNFLAKSSTAVAITGKMTPDKAASPSPSIATNQSSAKPRLVAKSVRDARSTPLPGQGASAGPDASKVWNRNRPAPPPPPKQFTDEELKQQYGIHLATRLQADEPGKGSKWADMEDDEDDWAPDTVEWMDGTKTTLQPSENQLPTPVERKQSPSKQESDDEQRASDPEKPSTSSVGPGKTILRPGARVTHSLTKPGLVLRSVPENPTPPPKPTSNSTAKSPWATLPPVDKVSPVNFNPSGPPPQPPSDLQRQNSTTDTSLPTPSPAKEIAADTFDRSWRTNERGSRELFDAKSGRYEPARGARRTSFRQEGSFRPPSVLQRPSQGEQDRNFSSQDARNFDRRRGSMNTSDHAGGDRRSSIDVTANELHERGNSPLAARSDASPVQSAPSDTSRSDINGGHRPYTAHSSEAGAHGPSVDGNSDVHVQQHQLMRQRIEANRRRKQEEQEREEAAKQERIRQKLRALDATSPSSPKSDKPNFNQANHPQADDYQTEKVLTEVETQQTIATDNKPTTSVVLPAPHESDHQPHLDGLGPLPSVLPPVSRAPIQVSPQPPENNREPSPFKNSSSSLPSSKPISPLHSSQSLQYPSHTSDSSAPLLKPHSDSSNLASSDIRHLHTTHTSTPPSFDRSPHHWAPAPVSHPSANWSTHSGPPPSIAHGNVWGPPTNDKALGNGAFESDFQRLHQLGYQPHQFRHSPQPPGPIAPPSVSPRPPFSSRSDINQSPVSNTMAPTQVIPSPTSSNFNIPANQASSKPASGAQSAKRPAFIPGLGRYDSRSKNAFSNFNGFSNMSQTAAAWNHFSKTVEAEEDATRRAQQALDANKPTGSAPERNYEVTFKKIGAADSLEDRRVVETTITKQLDRADQPSAQAMTTVPSTGLANTPRQSRFFGAGSDLVPASADPEVTEVTETSDAPPKKPVIEPAPPEAEAALFGSYVPTNKSVEANVPKVNLPKPKPIVNLPDKSNYPSQPPTQTVVMPQRPASFNRAGSQPIVSNVLWQQRFNLLFSRDEDQMLPPKPLNGAQELELKPRSSPIDSMSKKIATEKELGPQICLPITETSPIPISMPWPGREKYMKGDDAAETKSIDEKVFDEPENGSRPNIALATDLTSVDDNEETVSQASSRIRATPSKPATASTASGVTWDDRAAIHQIILNVAKMNAPKTIPVLKNKAPTTTHKNNNATTNNGPRKSNANNKPRKSPWAKPPKTDKTNGPRN